LTYNLEEQGNSYAKRAPQSRNDLE